MDIPPPPPPPPSPDDAPPPGAGPFGPPPPPPAPSPYGSTPYGTTQPYDAPPYESLPSYPQASYGQQPPYGQPPAYGAGPYQQGQYQQGPYQQGPYGYGYPGQPQPWYPEDRTTNGFAIASLVTAFTCIPFLGVILGFVGLRQIRRRRQQGKGLAVAGLVISGLSTSLVALIVTLGVTGVFDEGNTRVEDIRAGQCFNTVGHSLSDYSGGAVRSTRRVDTVPCDTRHDAEAYAVFTLDGASSDDDAGGGSDGDSAGVDGVVAAASERCASSVDDYLGEEPMPDTVDIFFFSYLLPRDGSGHRDRSVTCFFGSPGGKVTGSVKAGGHGAGVGV